MKLVLFGLLLSVAACGDSPEVTFVFAPLGDVDNCAASEAEIAAGTGGVWIGIRQDGVTIESSCVPVRNAGAWGDIEDTLADAGALIEDLPLGVPLQPFVMGLPPGAPCTPGDPSGSILFCGRTKKDHEEDPGPLHPDVVIDEEDGGGTVLIGRVCRAASNSELCFGE
jgi:hypothetical protein